MRWWRPIAVSCLIAGLARADAVDAQTVDQAHQFMIANLPQRLIVSALQREHSIEATVTEVAFDPADPCRVVMRLRDGRFQGLVFSFSDLSNRTVLGASEGSNLSFATGIHYSGDFRFVERSGAAQIFTASFRFSNSTMRDRADRAFSFMITHCLRAQGPF